MVADKDSVYAWPVPVPAGYASSLVSDGTGALWVTLWGPSFGALGRFDTATDAPGTYRLPDALARPTAVATDGHGLVRVAGPSE